MKTTPFELVRHANEQYQRAIDEFCSAITARTEGRQQEKIKQAASAHSRALKDLHSAIERMKNSQGSGG